MSADPAPIPLAEQIAAVRSYARYLGKVVGIYADFPELELHREWYDRQLAAMRAVLTTMEGIDHAG